MKLPSFLNQGDRPDRGWFFEGAGSFSDAGPWPSPPKQKKGGWKGGFEVGGGGHVQRTGGWKGRGFFFELEGGLLWSSEEGKKGAASCKHTRGEGRELGGKDSTRLGGRLRCRGRCLFEEGGAVEEAEGGQEARGCFWMFFFWGGGAIWTRVGSFLRGAGSL